MAAENRGVELKARYIVNVSNVGPPFNSTRMDLDPICSESIRCRLYTNFPVSFVKYQVTCHSHWVWQRSLGYLSSSLQNLCAETVLHGLTTICGYFLSHECIACVRPARTPIQKHTKALKKRLKARRLYKIDCCIATNSAHTRIRWGNYRSTRICIAKERGAKTAFYQC